MRLWSLHPEYLDRQGLLACWREGLLASSVIRGATRGYRRHPQLIRFNNTNNPLATISCYLRGLFEEANKRGYLFNEMLIPLNNKIEIMLTTTTGQLLYEKEHLIKKLRRRLSIPHKNVLLNVQLPKCHPIFNVEAADVESWEKLPVRQAI